MQNELNPCPFCGGKAVLVVNSHEHFETRNTLHVKVACSCCHISTQLYKCQTPDQLGQTIGHKPYKQAVKEIYELWNRRVDNAE